MQAGHLWPWKIPRSGKGNTSFPEKRVLWVKAWIELLVAARLMIRDNARGLCQDGSSLMPVGGTNYFDNTPPSPRSPALTSMEDHSRTMATPTGIINFLKALS
jgi:hypothetical protein